MKSLFSALSIVIALSAGCSIQPIKYVPVPTPVVQVPAAPVYVYPAPVWYTPYPYYYGPTMHFRFGGRRHRH